MNNINSGGYIPDNPSGINMLMGSGYTPEMIYAYKTGLNDGILSERKEPISRSDLILPEQSSNIYGMYFVDPITAEKRIFCDHSIATVIEMGNTIMLELYARTGRILISTDKKVMNSSRLIPELQRKGICFANIPARKLLQYFRITMSRYATYIEVPEDIKPGWYPRENELVFLDYQHKLSAYIPKLLEARYFQKKENIDTYLERNLSKAELLLTIIRLIPVLPNRKNTFGIYIETEAPGLIKQFLQIYSSERKNTIYLNQSWKEIKRVIKQLKNEPLFVMLKDTTNNNKEKQRVVDNMENIKKLIRNGYFEDLKFQGSVIFLGNTVFMDNMKEDIYYIRVSKEEISTDNMYIDIISKFVSLIIELIQNNQIRATWFEDMDNVINHSMPKKVDWILKLIEMKYPTQEIQQMRYKIIDIFNKSMKINQEWHQLDGVDEMFILKFLDIIKKGDRFNIVNRITGEVNDFKREYYNLFCDKNYILIQEDVFQDIIGGLCSKKFLLEQLASNEWLVLSQKVGRKYTQQKSVMINGNAERKYFLVFDRKKLEEVGLELYDKHDNNQYFI